MFRKLTFWVFILLVLITVVVSHRDTYRPKRHRDRSVKSALRRSHASHSARFKQQLAADFNARIETRLKQSNPSNKGFDTASDVLASPSIVNCSQYSEQRKALLTDFYHSLGGPGWTRNDNWLSNNISTWYGVRIESGCALSIIMRANNLQGTLPASIGEFPFLHILDIQNNALISGTVPPSIGSPSLADSLLVLSIGNNMISGTIPPEIGNLRTCQGLTFNGNRISGTVPEALSGLTGMELLFFDSMPFLSGTIPDAWFAASTQWWVLFFHNFPRLSGTLPSFLHISGLQGVELYDIPQLSGSLPSDLRALPALWTLDLRRLPLLSGRLPSMTAKISTLTITSVPMLSGTLPNIQGSNMKQLQLEGLPHVSGTLPASIVSQSHLQSLGIMSTAISGTLPAFPSQSEVIVISGHGFEGKLHEILAPSMQTVQLQLADSGVSGTIPSLSAPLLKQVILHHNRLSGTVNPSICALNSLLLFDISHNQISGAAPTCKMSSLSAFYSDGTQLSSFPSQLMRSPDLEIMSLTNNLISLNLTGDCIPFEHSSLASLDLSGNPLNVDVQSLIGCLVTSHMYEVIVRNASLTGVLDAALAISHNNILYTDVSTLTKTVYERCGQCALQLAVVDLSFNRVSGTLSDEYDAFPPWNSTDSSSITAMLPMLSSLSLKDTLVSLGALPTSMRSLDLTNIPVDPCGFVELIELASLRSLTAHGSLGMEFICASSNTSFLDVLKQSSRSVFNASLLLACPVWETKSGAEVSVDSIFANYTACQCVDGFYSRRSGADQMYSLMPCQPCPTDKLSCDPTVNDPLHVVKENYYPILPPDCISASCLTRAALVACRVDGICAVGQGGRPVLIPGYSCAVGYDVTSRLCSKCEDGFFRVKHRCYECHAYLPILVPIFMVLFLVAFSLLVFYQYRYMTSSAAVSITVFFLQLVDVINYRNRSFFQELTGAMSNFQPWAFECTMSALSGVHLEAMMLMPIILPLLVLVVRACVHLARVVTGTSSQSLLASLSFVFFYTWELLYIPVTLAVLETFACQTEHTPDGSTTTSFLTHVPFRSCDDPGLLAIAVITFTYYSVAYPVVSAVILYWKHSGVKTSTLGRAGDIMIVETRLWWWQPVLMKLRSLLLLAAQALLPFRSSLIPVLVAFVLLANILLQVSYTPYKRAADNRLSLLTLLSTLLIYISFIASQSDSQSDQLIILSILVVTLMYCGVTLLHRVHSRLRSTMKGGELVQPFLGADSLAAEPAGIDL